jgi:hypothetical protein
MDNQFSHVDQRFDDMRDTWLKHLEER